MRSFKAFAAIAALTPVLAASSGHAAKPPSWPGRCAKLRRVGGERPSPPDTVIQSAQWKPDGGTVSTSAQIAKVTVPFCRVIGVATPTRDSHIGFEVWLPPASAWNGNFRGEGSGGSSGNITPEPMNEALGSGYATMSTDNGHVVGATGGYGLEWAYQHPEKMIDWGWRALHLSTIAAKVVVRDFYGKPAGKNYFVACSGRRPSRHHGSQPLSRRL